MIPRYSGRGDEEPNWQVLADLSLSLVLVLFVLLAYVVIRHRGDNQRIRIAQAAVEALISNVAYADSAWKGRYRVCAAGPQHQTIVFSSDAAFGEDAWKLNDTGRRLVSRLGVVLAEISEVLAQVQVEGHTDARPISRPYAIDGVEVRSNWHLSTLRALDVVEVLLADSALAPRLSGVGRGEFHPVAPNFLQSGQIDSAGQAQNRRVQVTLVYSPEVADDFTDASLRETLELSRERIQTRIAHRDRIDPSRPRFPANSTEPVCTPGD